MVPDGVILFSPMTLTFQGYDLQNHILGHISVNIMGKTWAHFSTR